MLGSEILEVAIGLIFIVLIASLIATAFRECIESILKTRAVQLERGIRQMLDDRDGIIITKHLFDHPLLYGLFAGDYDPRTQLGGLVRDRLRIGSKDGVGERGPAALRINLGSNLPAYIPSRNFALALLDVISSDGTRGAGALNLESVKATAMTLPDGRLRQAILVALAEGENDIDQVRTSLEAWFDGTMDRVSGWYKRETQWILLAVGLALAVALNIDSLGIARDLSINNTLRQAMIAKVDAAYPQLRDKPNLKLTDEELRNQVAGLSDVVGWSRFWRKVDDRVARNAAKGKADPPSRRRIAAGLFFAALPGWILTALAVSLGAPFWFDILNKVMVIRSTVKPYEKSPPEGSEDRAGGRPSADRLAPGTPGGAGAGTPPSGGGGGAGAPLGGGGRPPSQPARANLRIAFDTTSFDPNTLGFTVGGQAVSVPADGFLELPLTVGEPHELAAAGRSGERDVAWRISVTLGLDDEARPVEARLS